MLAGPVGTKMGERVLGPAERRAVERACRAAVERAVRDLREDGLGTEDADHLLSLLERLAEEIGSDEVMADGSPVELDVIQRWREAATRLGQDPDTFPVAFDRLIERILVRIPEEIEEMAGASGSPLFPRLVISRLGRLDSALNALASPAQQRVLSLPPLAEPLRHELDEVRERCRMTGRALITPDILLLLLSLPFGRTAACFAAVRTGLDSTVQHMLHSYLATARPGPFRPFDWSERPDVLRARQLAAADDAAVVTDAHLLLGILDAGSTTSRQLVAWLGQDYDRLRSAAEAAAQGPHASPGTTPGVVFGGGN